MLPGIGAHTNEIISGGQDREGGQQYLHQAGFICSCDLQGAAEIMAPPEHGADEAQIHMLVKPRIVQYHIRQTPEDTFRGFAIHDW